MQVHLTPDDGIAAAMHQQLEVFDCAMFGDTQFSNRNNLTGDLLGIAGLDQLHRMDAFFWLNQQIAEQVSLYLLDLLGPSHGLEVHIQKAWPVVCSRDGGTIESHIHRNAQLSAMFYVCTEEDPGSGELESQAPDTYFSHVMAIPFREATSLVGCLLQSSIACCSFPQTCAIPFCPTREWRRAIRCRTTWPSLQPQDRVEKRSCPIPWIGFQWVACPQPERIRPAKVPP
jgi:uncharacterized protein (TIGR02466 family)